MKTLLIFLIKTMKRGFLSALTMGLLLNIWIVDSFSQKVTPIVSKSRNKKPPVPVKTKPNESDAKLIAAVKAEDIEEVKKLLTAGADPNAIDRSIGFRVPVLNVILQQESNPAVEREIAILLINAGADVNGHGNTFYPPLLLALDVEVVKLLIKKGADVNHQTSFAFGVTPLHCANAETIPLLIAAGARLNEVDDNGNTPLMLNISVISPPSEEDKDEDNDDKDYQAYKKEEARKLENIIKCVQLLLRAGADTKIKNKEGQTALALARETKRARVIEMLEKAGAK